MLQSANFGKGFLGPEITQEIVDKFTDTCRQLRVLNTVRHEVVGIPITYRQYVNFVFLFLFESFDNRFLRLSPGVLIDRYIQSLFVHLVHIRSTCNINVAVKDKVDT